MEKQQKELLKNCPGSKSQPFSYFFLPITTRPHFFTQQISTWPQGQWVRSMTPGLCSRKFWLEVAIANPQQGFKDFTRQDPSPTWQTIVYRLGNNSFWEKLSDERAQTERLTHRPYWCWRHT